MEQRIVLVTGGGRGLGRGIALNLARRGATVVIVGRTQSSLDETVGLAATDQRIHAFTGDVSDAEAIRDTIDRAVSKLGRLDVLVNNAGIVTPGTLEETGVDAYRQMMGVNADGVVYTTLAALPHLRASRGCIVNIGSVSAVRADTGLAAYNMSKGALVNLTNALALDYGAEIRVNAVHPGAVIVDDLSAQALARDTPVELLYRERTPMRRIATADEVADVVAFLASTDAHFVNGAHIPVDGGVTASNGQPSFATVAAALAEMTPHLAR